jgi:hypothetical protein
MRDYWLTQYLLSAIGWGYLIIVLIVLGIVLWLIKGKVAKTVAFLIVLGLASILPIQGYREYLKEREVADAHRARLAKAQALFDERCKTAGEKIYKTMDGVDGVVWMKWRPSGLNQGQFSLDDPYGKDCSGEGCILRLLRGNETSIEEQAQSPTPSLKYKYVETIDPSDGVHYRYTGISKSITEVPKDEFLLHVQRTGSGADTRGRFLALQRQPIKKFSANFGLIWDDVSTRGDRESWIAGGSLKVVEVQTNELIAERVGYLIDTGQGSTAGARDPWSWARSYAPKCPQRSENTVDFAVRVLKPGK